MTDVYHRRGLISGWCRAMLWTYQILGWSRISRRELQSLIKKLDSSQIIRARVEVRRCTAKQVEFLRWACDSLGIKPLSITPS